ncbi:desmoglein-2-like isoform X4 [Cetorhinus maximus]
MPSRTGTSGAGLILMSLLLLTYYEVAQCSCERGFARRRVEAEIAPRVSKGEIVLTVQFQDCALGRNIRLRTSDNSFEVDPAGVVRVTQPQTVGPKHKFKVSAEDSETHETWAVDVQLIAPRKTELVKRSLQVIRFPAKHSSRRQKREWVIPPLDIVEHEQPTHNPIAVIRSDAEDKPGFEITYTITGKGANEPPIGLFVIDPKTGELNITGVVDREKNPVFKLIGQAYDQHGLKMENPIELIVRVLDINDNRPVFTKSIFTSSVEELSPLGTFTLQLTATDADTGTNAQIYYRIITADIRRTFVATGNGEIKVLNPNLDRETQDFYRFLVEARDRGGNIQGLSTTATAEIRILDVNDHIPSVQQLVYLTNVSENTKNVEILRVKVTDEDLEFSDNWLAQFFIIDGNEDQHFRFEVDNRTNEGILIVQKELDYEEMEMVNLVVHVTNKAPFHSSVPNTNNLKSIKIKILVKNMKEGFKFRPSIWNVMVKESITGKKVRQVLGKYPAVSADTEEQSKMTRYAKNFDEANWLVINSETGEVTLVGVADRESKYVINGTYTATILAINNEHGHTSTSTGTIVIRVEDANDNLPNFENLHPCMCSNTKSLNLTASDPDGHPYGAPFSFNINSNKKWKLGRTDATSTELIPLIDLWPGMFTVPITVRDNGGNGHLVNLNIRVTDCHDSTMCSAEKLFQSTNAFLGGAAIGLMILALLLLLLVPLLLLLCQCGGQIGGKGFLMVPDEAEGTLGKSSIEGGGQVDTMVPLISPVDQLGMHAQAKGIAGGSGMVGSGGMVSSGGVVGSGKMVSSGGMVGSGAIVGSYGGKLSQTDGRSEQRAIWLESNYGSSEADLSRLIPLDNGNVYFKRHGNSTFRGSWSRMLEGSCAAYVKQYLNQKLTASAEGGEPHPAPDVLLIFNNEGMNSPVGSLGSCSSIEGLGDDDSFLNDLGPKFKTLAEICRGQAEGQCSALGEQPETPEPAAAAGRLVRRAYEAREESFSSEAVKLQSTAERAPAHFQKHVVVTTTINPSREELPGRTDPMLVQRSAMASTRSGIEELRVMSSNSDPALAQKTAAASGLNSRQAEGTIPTCSPIPAVQKNVVVTRSVHSGAGEVPGMVTGPSFPPMPLVQKNVTVTRSVNSDAGEMQGMVGQVPVIQKNIVVGRSVNSGAGGVQGSSFTTEPAIVANLVTGASGGGTYRSVKKVTKTVQLVQE